MKRIFALLLALLLLAALTGCWPPEEQYTEKPVIYLYPEAETDVTVRLDYVGDLTCTYPAYDGAWRVAAAPDGTLTDENGQTYRYLYWEGTDNVQYDFSEGFCVPGSETAAFLEDALAQLGLTRAEANEFIIYWLPQMEQNAYNGAHRLHRRRMGRRKSPISKRRPEKELLRARFMGSIPIP